MCVIVFKPAGAECPSLKTLKSCWESNPDGAGVALSERKSVYTRKGFMKFDELEEFYTLNKFGDRVCQAIMFHFRIGTHGLKDAGNTHPFPVSADPCVLRQLTGRFPVAVAHNGVFSNKVVLPKVSDTGQFMADCASEGGDVVSFWSKHPQITGWSRLIVMEPGAKYTLLGDWHCQKDCGCFFSNMSWQWKSHVPPAYGYGAGGHVGTYYGIGGYGDGFCDDIPWRGTIPEKDDKKKTAVIVVGTPDDSGARASSGGAPMTKEEKMAFVIGSGQSATLLAAQDILTGGDSKSVSVAPTGVHVKPRSEKTPIRWLRRS